jgi:endo-1,4-beta-xylanase
VQNNEWGSSAPEWITTDGNADFTVANSSISNGTSGAPGGYPSIYQGCHWGSCSAGGLSSSPVQVSNLTQGKVTTSWSKSTGSGTLNGWRLGWTFPGNQAITGLWNASYTQSGAGVSVTNASYDGTLAPGDGAAVGFTATGSTASPTVTCS